MDLPPSAGQPQADLVRRQAPDGVIIATTPQDLSLPADAPLLGRIPLN